MEKSKFLRSKHVNVFYKYKDLLKEIVDVNLLKSPA